MIFLSIVIPCYNSQETIVSLLDSITQSAKVDFSEIEIVIVDDCSTDETIEFIKGYFELEYQKAPKRGSTSFPSFPSFRDVRIVCLVKNQGPAHARNVGVKYAQGKIVLFLDADVKVYRNTLYETVKSFKKDADLFALTGVWDKKQRTNKFFPKFKALRDWSYWINERDPKNYYYLFSTRVAAINRELFLRLGGFDETYKAALVEDIEFTYRIAKRYAVIFNPKVIVAHEFEDFWPIAKKYFWRSYYWSKIYRERKKFDPVATTSKEALTTISAGGLVATIGLIGLIGLIGQIGQISLIGLIGQIGLIGLISFFLHFLGVRKFLWFCFKQEGLWFAVRAFFTGIALYLVILAGAVASFVRR